MSRRGVVGLLAALSVAVLAGCTSGTPEPTPEAATPAPAATPTPDDTCDLTVRAADCVAWSVEDVDPLVAVGEELVVAARGRELLAYAAGDGRQLWRSTPPDGALLAGAQVVGAGVVVTTTLPTGGEGLPPGETCLLAAADGREVWCAPGLASPAPAGVDLAPLLEGDEVVVLEAASGEELWRLPTTGLLGPAFDDGQALVGGAEGVALVDALDGTVLWQVEEDRSGLPPGAAAGELADATAVVRTGAGRLLVDRQTGEVTATPDALPAGSIEVVAGAVIAALPDSSVSGVGATGTTTWTQRGEPLPARDGAVLLIGAEREGREFIALLDPLDGEVLWQVPADTDVTQVAADEAVVAIARPGSVTLHDRSSGAVVLRAVGPNPSIESVTPLVVTTGGRLTRITIE